MQIILGSMNLGRLNEMCDGGDVVLDRQDWWDIYTAAGNIIP
jgi:predicted oxidoreductase